jgi:transcriptional regulator with XRE-family HTH domain
MASALTRFGLLCRDLRGSQDRTMGDQAEALQCDVCYISAVETGRTPPSDEYVEKFGRWLNLEDSQYQTLKKRSKATVIDMRHRFSTSNRSNSMRLFRKISKMDPSQIRNFRRKIEGEAENDRRLSGPVEIG